MKEEYIILSDGISNVCKCNTYENNINEGRLKLPYSTSSNKMLFSFIIKQWEFKSLEQSLNKTVKYTQSKLDSYVICLFVVKFYEFIIYSLY